MMSRPTMIPISAGLYQLILASAGKFSQLQRSSCEPFPLMHASEETLDFGSCTHEYTCGKLSITQRYECICYQVPGCCRYRGSRWLA